MPLDPKLVQEIIDLPTDWHGAGTLPENVLRAIGKYCFQGPKLEHTLETGTGKSTLLFSHISKSHLVFAIDEGKSLTMVRESPLLNKESVFFVEGPTQLTLPSFDFDFQVQVALIDGPHGYPFPDLEYYYVYQVLEPGAILIVDDIKIPSIARMFKIIRADQMFELIKVFNGNTAFFRRTNHKTFDPLGDGWWLQGHNEKRHLYLQFRQRLRPTLHKLRDLFLNQSQKK